MKNIFRRDKRSTLDKEIDNVIEVMALVKPDSKEYTVMASNLDILLKAKAYDKSQAKVSKDTILTVAGSIAGILIIVAYEHAHIVASKAIGFVIKGRV